MHDGNPKDDVAQTTGECANILGICLENYRNQRESLKETMTSNEQQLHMINDEVDRLENALKCLMEGKIRAATMMEGKIRPATKDEVRTATQPIATHSPNKIRY